jgi:1-deoxy-D-xylulose-5-phosphate synthase
MNSVEIFVPIYSSFLQRAYDQISHDIARQNLHIVIGVDRSGLVGDDGETHQGLYDIAYLKHIPNMVILQPKDAFEAYMLLDYAFNETKHPVAIRYSRNKTYFKPGTFVRSKMITKPTWTEITETGVIEFITYGDNVNRIYEIINNNNLPVHLVNARFIKPMDIAMVKKILDSNHPVIVLEDVTKISGLGSSILEFAADCNLFPQKMTILGLPDKFIEQGKQEEIFQKYGLDDLSILTFLKTLLNQ